MHILSMRAGTHLSLVAAQNAPTGWACLGWTGGATAVPIPPAWEPEPKFCRLAARAANRSGLRYGSVRLTGSCRGD